VIPGQAAMIEPEPRWKQRFNNYLRAFRALDGAVKLAASRDLSDLEEQGLIQAFEFTHELGWNVLKDYLENQGLFGLIGSKDAARQAFRNGLLTDGEAWMGMVQARNLTSHTYDQALAKGMVKRIIEDFHPAFQALAEKFGRLYERAVD